MQAFARAPSVAAILTREDGRGLAVQGSDAHVDQAEDDVCRDDFFRDDADERLPPLLSGQLTVESSVDGDAEGAEALKRLERRHEELSGLLVWTKSELNTTARSVHKPNASQKKNSISD